MRACTKRRSNEKLASPSSLTATATSARRVAASSPPFPTPFPACLSFHLICRLALHNIVYIRGLFPAESFKNSTQFGMAQAKLTGDTPETQRILNMLEKGVMHAIKMKYAKTITFYITDPVQGLNDEENILEEYVFKVRYGSRDGEVALDDITIRRGGGGKEGNARAAARDGTTSAGADRSAQTTVSAGPRVRGARRLDDEEYIKRAAANMVRSLCALIRTLEPMPAERKFSMKLTYVDETVTETKRCTQLAQPWFLFYFLNRFFFLGFQSPSSNVFIRLALLSLLALFCSHAHGPTASA